jgi:mono/diheme cytochrome c family protein
MASLRRACAAGIAGLVLLASSTGSAAADEALGRQIFVDGAGGLPPCALCHVLSAAGATGEIGPDLDQLRPDPEKIRAAVRDGVGVMPPFGEVLRPEEIDAVVAYVSAALGE